MLDEADTPQDSAAGLMPAPRTPWRVAEVRVVGDFRLAVRFNDGLTGEVDLAPLVHSPDAGVFAALRDPDMFRTVSLDYGAVAWPQGPDLAPDAMHRAIKKDKVWRP